MNQQQTQFINDHYNKLKTTVTINYKIIITIFLLSILTMFLSMLFTLVIDFYTRLFLFIPFGFIMGLIMSCCFIIYIQNGCINDESKKSPTKIPPDNFDDFMIINK